MLLRISFDHFAHITIQQSITISTYYKAYYSTINPIILVCNKSNQTHIDGTTLTHTLWDSNQDLPQWRYLWCLILATWAKFHWQFFILISESTLVAWKGGVAKAAPRAEVHISLATPPIGSPRRLQIVNLIDGQNNGRIDCNLTYTT